MKLAERVLLRGWAELDHPHPAEARAHPFHPVDECRAPARVAGPDAVLVRSSVTPEAVALELATGGGQRGPARVTAALPVDVLKAPPLVARERRPAVVGQHGETVLGEDVEPVVIHCCAGAFGHLAS